MVEFADLSAAETGFSVIADGFEPAIVESVTWEPGPNRWQITLDAEGAWAIGRSIVLGTNLVSREVDGSAMTFSVDLTVMDENGEALQTLTSADFSVDTYECGWGGPRDCASDGEGNSTGGFSPDGGADAFELVPGASRHPYLAALVVDHSSDSCWRWDQRATALKSFFGALGGNDVASLMTAQVESDETTLTAHGPFTSDGSVYLDVLEDLTCSEGLSPEMREVLGDAINVAATADGFGLPDTERHVVVIAIGGLTAPEVDAVAQIARASGVRISTIVDGSVWDGLAEAAVRTGGSVSRVSDWQWRDAGMVFAALDQVLAGTLPFYRMQFSLVGEPGTFVPGGNAKVYLHIDVPASMPHRGVLAEVNVAIP
jgi:hypothetical protein